MMSVTVKFFAIARDLTRTSHLPMELPEHSTTEQLLAEIARRYPALGEWKPYLRLAVNQSYISAAVPLHDGDEIAVIPPVSGG